MHTRNINTVPKMKKKTSIFSVLIKNIIIRKKRKKKCKFSIGPKGKGTETHETFKNLINS